MERQRYFLWQCAGLALGLWLGVGCVQGPSEAQSPLAAPAVGASLVAFVLVYFAVFGVGTWYILKLMHGGVHVHESDLGDAPIRTAGVTPTLQVQRQGHPA